MNLQRFPLGHQGLKEEGQMLTEISGELYRMETTSSHSATSVDSASVMSDLEVSAQ